MLLFYCFMDIKDVDKIIGESVSNYITEYENLFLYKELHENVIEKVTNIFKNNHSIKRFEKILEIDLNEYLSKYTPASEGYIMIKQFKDALQHIYSTYYWGSPKRQIK